MESGAGRAGSRAEWLMGRHAEVCKICEVELLHVASVDSISGLALEPVVGREGPLSLLKAHSLQSPTWHTFNLTTSHANSICPALAHCWRCGVRMHGGDAELYVRMGALFSSVLDTRCREQNPRPRQPVTIVHHPSSTVHYRQMQMFTSTRYCGTSSQAPVGVERLAEQCPLDYP